MKLAVVDDAYNAQELIADYLADYGYNVRGFRDPDEMEQTALEYDGIIMDVMIGRDRTRGITSIQSWAKSGMLRPGTLVVLISSFGRERKEISDLLSELKSSIAFEWLDKTFDTSFFNRLQSIIEAHRK